MDSQRDSLEYLPGRMLKAFKNVLLIFSVLFCGLYMPEIYHPSPSFADSKGYALQDLTEAAQNYMNHEQWDFASFEWRTILSQDPKNIDAHVGLAAALFHQGLPQDAIDHLEQARQEIPSLALDMALANDYREMKNFTKAGQVLQSALTKNPYEIQAFKGLKSILEQLPENQKKEAKQLLESQSREAKAKAKDAIKSGDFALAARYYDIVSTYTGRLGDVNDHGLLLFLSGNREAAISRLRLVNDNGGVACETRANQAIVALSLRRYGEAQQMMEDELGRCDNSQIKPKLYNDLGYIYENDNKWTKAKFAYEKAVELKPGFTKALMNLGYIYQRDRAYNTAIKLFQDYLEREPRNADVWNQLGFTYELDHKPKHAIDAYKKAIEMNPHFKDPYYNLGVVYRKMDKIEDSNKVLKMLSEVEFAEMENSGKDKTASKPKQELLFDYVDLFFSEPVL